MIIRIKGWIKRVVYATAILFKKTYCLFTKKEIWVFSAWEAKLYSDNPKYLFEYVLQNRKKQVAALWLTNNTDLYKELKAKRLPVFAVTTEFRRNLITAIADKFFFSDLSYPLESQLNKKPIYINLWHGMPIKFIGNLSHIKQHFLVATNKSSQQIMATTMQMDVSKVLLTGQPKNDGLFTKKSLRTKLGIDKNSYIILYMPTYRGSFNCTSMGRNNKSGILLEQNEELKTFNNMLEKQNAYFVIKPHLRNKIDTNYGSRFLVIDDFKELVPEIDNYEIMGNANMLISDYSSILLDYYVTNRPILFYTPDFKEYSSTQQLNYDYAEISSGEQIFSQEDLLKRIEFYLKNRTFLPENYKKTKDFFNIYSDADSSKRVFQTFINSNNLSVN